MQSLNRKIAQKNKENRVQMMQIQILQKQIKSLYEQQDSQIILKNELDNFKRESLHNQEIVLKQLKLERMKLEQQLKQN